MACPRSRRPSILAGQRRPGPGSLLPQRRQRAGPVLAAHRRLGFVCQPRVRSLRLCPLRQRRRQPRGDRSHRRHCGDLSSALSLRPGQQCRGSRHLAGGWRASHAVQFLRAGLHQCDAHHRAGHQRTAHPAHQRAHPLGQIGRPLGRGRPHRRHRRARSQHRALRHPGRTDQQPQCAQLPAPARAGPHPHRVFVQRLFHADRHEHLPDERDGPDQ